MSFRRAFPEPTNFNEIRIAFLRTAVSSDILETVMG